jgi:hypothetical protein
MLFAGSVMGQKSTRILTYKSDYLVSMKKVVYVQREFTHIYCYLENSANVDGGLVVRDSEVDTLYATLKKCLISFKAWTNGGINPRLVGLSDGELFWFDENQDVQSARSDLMINFKVYEGRKLMTITIDDFVTALSYNEAVAFTRLFSPAVVFEKQ